MDRRLFISSAVTLPLLASDQADAAPPDAPTKGVHVPAGEDRSKQPLKLGSDRLDVKVSTKDTGGAMFIFEETKVGKGGPPRHLHLEQDEWFYVSEGEFRIEVGEETFTANPGDSVLGPRKVPHAWACLSDTGTILFAVQPAGKMEAFMGEVAKLTKPTKEELEKLHEAHGLKVAGPPLKID